MKTSLCIVGACVLGSIATNANAKLQEGRTGIENWPRCTALQDVTIPAAAIGLASGAGRVTRAELIPAAGVRYELQRDAAGGFKAVPVATRDLNPNGEYCLVVGEILPATRASVRIIFHLALPSRWSGKSLHTDGRGDNDPPAPVAPSFDGIAAPLPIARGYAVYSREWGANEPLFQHNEAAKKAHDVAMFLIAKHYGTSARYRYYSGGGGAGYESLTMIQKYPDDYDGVLTQFPVYSVTAMLHGQAVRRAGAANGGAGEIGPAQTAFLRKEVLASCDGLDGLQDAIVSNVAACRVDFARLRCPNHQASGHECFSDSQLETLRNLHTSIQLPYSLPSGETHLSAFSIGADWDSTLRAAAAGNPGRDETRDLFLGGDPHADVLAFDPLQPSEQVLVRIRELSRSYDRSGPNIDGFVARGGKWILTHGWADEFAAPGSSIEHYRKLVARYGQAKVDEVMRFYLIPGYGHAAAVAFNANGAPNLEALEDWVERGLAPGTLTVVDTNPGVKVRSRPMCVFPAWPKYQGTGDPDLATSFSCVSGSKVLSDRR